MTAEGTQLRLVLAVGKLPAELRDHVLRVVFEAKRLARCHGVDEERAAVAALGHDLLRAHSRNELLRKAEEAGLTIPDVEREEPVLLHGRLGAYLLKKRFAVDDDDVLAAARYHTTGRAGMSVLEQIVFVADKIEPEKALDKQGLTARRLADRNLGAAVRLLLDAQVAKARTRGWPLHPDTIAALEERGPLRSAGGH